jgi:hypothetical protein
MGGQPTIRDFVLDDAFAPIPAIHATVGQIAGGRATTMPMSPEAGNSAVSPPRRGLGPTEKIHPPSIIRSGHHREAATPACGDLSVQHPLIGLPALKFLRRPYGGPVGERKRSSVERLGSFTRQVRARTIRDCRRSPLRYIQLASSGCVHLCLISDTGCSKE